MIRSTFVYGKKYKCDGPLELLKGQIVKQARVEGTGPQYC